MFPTSWNFLNLYIWWSYSPVPEISWLAVRGCKAEWYFDWPAFARPATNALTWVFHVPPNLHLSLASCREQVPPGTLISPQPKSRGRQQAAQRKEGLATHSQQTGCSCWVSKCGTRAPSPPVTSSRQQQLQRGPAWGRTPCLKLKRRWGRRAVVVASIGKRPMGSTCTKCFVARPSTLSWSGMTASRECSSCCCYCYSLLRC